MPRWRKNARSPHGAPALTLPNQFSQLPPSVYGRLRMVEFKADGGRCRASGLGGVGIRGLGFRWNILFVCLVARVFRQSEGPMEACMYVCIRKTFIQQTPTPLSSIICVGLRILEERRLYCAIHGSTATYESDALVTVYEAW